HRTLGGRHAPLPGVLGRRGSFGSRLGEFRAPRLRALRAFRLGGPRRLRSRAARGRRRTEHRRKIVVHERFPKARERLVGGGALVKAGNRVVGTCHAVGWGLGRNLAGYGRHAIEDAGLVLFPAAVDLFELERIGEGAHLAAVIDAHSFPPQLRETTPLNMRSVRPSCSTCASTAAVSLDAMALRARSTVDRALARASRPKSAEPTTRSISGNSRSISDISVSASCLLFSKSSSVRRSTM